MERRLIAGHSPYERIAGFSRAVAVGRDVFVAGTAPIPRDGGEPPRDAYGQAVLCIELVLEALARAGASASDVVRTRMYLAAAKHFEGAARAHGEVFGDVRPVTTGVVVGLLDPRWLVEIEAQALIGAKR